MGRVNEQHVDKVRQYVDARSRNDTRKVLELVSDDIVLEGKLASAKGKEEFGAYLDRTKARGNWGDAYIVEGDGEYVRVDGIVKVTLVKVKLESRFYMNDQDEICRIWLGVSWK